jgi:hypothetical protein
MKGAEHRVARRKLNRIELRSLTVIVPVDEIFVDAVDDDEATLESSDGSYKKTVSVKQIGDKFEEQFMKIVFPGVVPGKEYSLIYDTHLDDETEMVTKVTMFQKRLIDADDMEKPLRLDIPFEIQGREDDGGSSGEV